jgi:hypothetical protein
MESVKQEGERQFPALPDDQIGGVFEKRAIHGFGGTSGKDDNGVGVSPFGATSGLEAFAFGGPCDGASVNDRDVAGSPELDGSVSGGGKAAGDGSGFRLIQPAADCFKGHGFGGNRWRLLRGVHGGVG